MANYTKYTLKDFIALIGPIVKQVHGEGGRLFPSVRIAQSWLETGGNIPNWNNVAGYKVGSGKLTPYWRGESVNTATKEVYNGITVNTTANWRAYDSLYNFYKDQDLLFDNSRYTRVREAKTSDEQCTALYLCGYATDPQYADKLRSIIKKNELQKYDIPEAKEDKFEEDEKMNLVDYQWKMLEENIKLALDEKLLNDKAWLEKVQKRTITNSELNWMNNVLIIRKMNG